MEPEDGRIICEVIAKRGLSQRADWQWIGKIPNVKNILQRERSVLPGDIGKFVLSVKRPGSTHHQFCTPITVTDKIFWTNGLDNVETFAESFALFASAEEACAIGHKFRWEESSVYEVVLADPTTVVLKECLSATGNGMAASQA